MSRGDFDALDRAGLNLQAVFDLDTLPEAVVAPSRRDFDPGHRSRQLIVIGNAGRAMWATVKAAGIASADPIDDFSVRTAEAWFAGQFAGHWHAIVYPGEAPVGLQTLDVAGARKTLCAGRDVAVAFVTGDRTARIAEWRDKLAWDAPTISPYAQADGKVLFEIAKFPGRRNGPGC